MVKLGEPCQLLSVVRHVALLSRRSQVVHNRVRIRKILRNPICNAGEDSQGVPFIQSGKCRLRVAQ